MATLLKVVLSLDGRKQINKFTTPQYLTGIIHFWIILSHILTVIQHEGIFESVSVNKYGKFGRIPIHTLHTVDTRLVHR